MVDIGSRARGLRGRDVRERSLEALRIVEAEHLANRLFGQLSGGERQRVSLARALAHVINILDPDVIVLGGGLSNIDRLYDTVPTLWREWVFSDTTTTELLPPVHGDSGGVRGAAWLWPPDA